MKTITAFLIPVLFSIFGWFISQRKNSSINNPNTVGETILCMKTLGNDFAFVGIWPRNNFMLKHGFYGSSASINKNLNNTVRKLESSSNFLVIRIGSICARLVKKY
jgi:hypothetical protein